MYKVLQNKAVGEDNMKGNKTENFDILIENLIKLYNNIDATIKIGAISDVKSKYNKFSKEFENYINTYEITVRHLVSDLDNKKWDNKVEEVSAKLTELANVKVEINECNVGVEPCTCEELVEEKRPKF